jgi:hypothetical protein
LNTLHFYVKGISYTYSPSVEFRMMPHPDKAGCKRCCSSTGALFCPLEIQWIQASFLKGHRNCFDTFPSLRLMLLFDVSNKSREVHNTSPVITNMRKGGINYFFLTGSTNIPSISKSIFKRFIASLASRISLKGPAMTRCLSLTDSTVAGICGP